MTKTGIQVNNAQYTTFKHEGWQLGLDQHNFGDDADKPSVKTSSTNSSASVLAVNVEQQQRQS